MTSNTFNFTRWLMTNIIGWFIGVILVISFSILADTLGIEGVQFFVAIAIGLGLGTAQYLQLKKYFNVGKLWILYTTLGLGIPFIVFDVLNILDLIKSTKYFLPICVSIGGILAGIGQASLLKHLQPNILQWTLLSFLSWLLTALSVYSIEYSKQLVPITELVFVVNLFMILIGGAIIGIITGIYLNILAKTRR